MLDAVRGDVAVELVEFDLGADRYLRTGETLPDDELERCAVSTRSSCAVGDPRVRPGCSSATCCCGSGSSSTST